MSFQDKINALWVEKYRPTELDEIVLPDDTKATVQKYIGKGIIPNLFLCSAAGQGKTSLAKMLAKNIFKVDYLYVNASDENNVNTVRNKISEFARTASFDGRFKIVILDECDNFASKDAQLLLRALMEEVSENTRFILTANHGNRVEDAIKSRCVELDITPPKSGVGKRVVEVLKKEGVSVGKEQLPLLKGLINRFYPDVRSIIKHLQECVDENGTLEVREFETAASFIETVVNKILEETPMELRKFIITHELDFGANYHELLYNLYKTIITTDKLDAARKAKWTITIAEYCARFSTAIDAELNATACLFSLCEN